MLACKDRMVPWDEIVPSYTSTETETLPGMRWRLSRCLVEVHLGFLVLVLCTSYNLNLLHQWRRVHCTQSHKGQEMD